MASQNQLIRSCVLRVDVKCCSGCQASAKRKLQRIPGVSAIEFNAEEGLMTVSGDVNPMMLVQKFARWGRNAELVSVQNQPPAQNSPANSSASSPNLSRATDGGRSPVLDNPEHNDEKRKKKKKKQIKCCWLLRWFGKKTSKAKVEPVPFPVTIGENRSWQLPMRLENGRAWSFPNAPPPPPPPVMYPHQHQAIHGGGPPRPPYPPYFGTVPPPPLPPPLPLYGAGMFRMPPPPSPPYFQARQPLSPQMVNPMVHYGSY